MTRPLWYALAAYLMWGLFPLYWGLIRHVPTAQAMGHRVVWSAVVLGALVAGSRRRRTLGGVTRRVIGIYAVAAVLIGVNWTIYVWAVNAGFVVQTSLGYFITPLISVLLGVVVLRERLRRLQWIAVALATAGVLHLTRTYGALPWIALGLAISFGTYGLIKKRAPLPPVEGLLLETVILTPIALVYLVAIQRGGSGLFLHAGLSTDLLLVGTGLLTVVPLLLFATAVQRAPLSIVGILQYVSPTMQFLLGIFFFHEQFSTAQFTGFTLVWSAVLLFGVDGLLARRSPLAGEPVT
jgi:chloramphenicol-sensitive protein RarD